MPEPINVLIANALFAHLTTPAISGVTETNRAKPLVAFTPTARVAYIDVHPLLRADPEHFGIAFDGSDILRGIFQVDAVMPDGNGEAPGVRLASLIAARFALGTTLTVGAGSAARHLRVTNTPTIAAAVKDAPWVRFPVSIPYLVIT